MRGNDGADQSGAATLRNYSALLDEAYATYGMNQIALTERRPVQPVRLIQNKLVQGRRSSGALRRA